MAQAVSAAGAAIGVAPVGKAGTSIPLAQALSPTRSRGLLGKQSSHD